MGRNGAQWGCHVNWQTLLAIDFDRWAAETYRANFPGVRVECADPQSRTVIDLFCGGGLGAVGWHGRAWRYEPAETEAA